jgi:hypothetical protein
MRTFTHKLLIKLIDYKENLYEFLGPSPSETKW